MLKAGTLLLQQYDLLADRSGRPTADPKALLRLTCRFLRAWRRAGGKCTIKHQLDVHLVTPLRKRRRSNLSEPTRNTEELVETLPNHLRNLSEPTRNTEELVETLPNHLRNLSEPTSEPRNS